MAKVWRTAAAMMWIGLWGCSGDDAAGAVSELATHRGEGRIAADVDVAGALLALGSGAEVEIPRGALRGSVMVELEEIEPDALPPRPAAQGLDGPLAFRPHGQTFEVDVVIEMPIDAVPEGRRAQLLRLDDEEDRQWEEVKGFRLRDANQVELLDGDSRQRVSFASRHFSVYWVVAETVGGVGQDGGATQEDAGIGEEDSGAGMSDGGSSPATCDNVDCVNGFTCIEDKAGPRCVAPSMAADAGTGSTGGDAGQKDAGSGADAGRADAGASQDAGVGEGGTFDAGGDASQVDAGPGADAGLDAGAAPDAGASDAGTIDAGTGGQDAGVAQDSSVDAGTPPF